MVLNMQGKWVFVLYKVGFYYLRHFRVEKSEKMQM